MKVAIVQHNPTVGDFDGNLKKIIHFYREAVSNGAELVVLPELALWGYPPGDLLLDPWRHYAHDEAFASLCAIIGFVPVIIGISQKSSQEHGKLYYNAAAFVCDGNLVAVQRKMLLPTYDIFDERRYFEPNVRKDIVVVEYRQQRIAMLICEDIWGGSENANNGRPLYDIDPVKLVAQESVDLLVTINASPYYWGKGDDRRDVVRDVARTCHCPVVYAAQVGVNTEIVFDGRSMVCASNGDIAQMSPYQEYYALFDTGHIDGEDISDVSIKNLYDALVMGVRDYYAKSGCFSGALVGLSGGIDSALTLAIAADALGPEKLKAVSLPSCYTSDMSNEDAQIQAETMGILHTVISIAPAVSAFNAMLVPSLHAVDGITAENIQARSRGVTLMAISNKENRLLLTTGNKSEMAVGYATLYGDMSGGLAVIADVPKLDVYRLAQYRNTISHVIPERVIKREPSAELAPDQVDRNTLPAYDVLDPILEAYIEERISPTQIVSRGHDRGMVERICSLVDRNEYKRRQAAPVIRVTSKAFGTGRRYPIVARY